MLRKTTKRNEEYARKTNAFGWLRKRGGAGSVACALAVTALVLSLSITAAACRVGTPIDETKGTTPSGSLEPATPEPQVSPDIKEVSEPHAGIPSRIPI